jgi:hypothetical protein
MLPDLQDLHDLWVREAPRVERIIFEVDVRADCNDGSEFADSGDSIEEGGMQEWDESTVGLKIYDYTYA